MVYLIKKTAKMRLSRDTQHRNNNLLESYLICTLNIQDKFVVFLWVTVLFFYLLGSPAVIK